MTTFGVKADLLKPPPNESGGYRAALNEDLKKFDKLSQSYTNQNWRLSSFGRAAFPKLTVRDSANQRFLLDYLWIKLLAFLPEGDEAASGAIADGYEKRSGNHACRTADLVIFVDLARLHEEEADQRGVLPLLYIVATGLPVTTAATASSLRPHAKTSSGKRSRTPTSDAKRHSFPGYKGIEC